MTKEEQVGRGQRANAILSDPLFAEAFDGVRERLISVMETAKTDDATLKAKLCLGLLNDAKQYLSRVITDGLMAAEQLKFEAEEKKRRGWFS